MFYFFKIKVNENYGQKEEKINQRKELKILDLVIDLYLFMFKQKVRDEEGKKQVW